MSLINKPRPQCRRASEVSVGGRVRPGRAPRNNAQGKAPYAMNLFSPPYRFTLSAATKLAVVVTAVAGITSGIVAHDEAGATSASSAQQANPTITITSEDIYFTFSPAQLEARVGQAITVTNNDPYGAHSVVEKNRSFFVDVPPNSSATLTVSQAGIYQYFCDWHADAHEPRYGSLNVS